MNLLAYLFPTLALLGTLSLSLMLMPVWLQWVQRFQLVDQPGGRKAHVRPTPTGGGIAILLAWLGIQLSGLGTGDAPLLPLWFGAGLLALAGLQDDLQEMGPGRKFLFQFVAAGLLVAQGGTLPLPGPAWLSYVITFVFVVGLSNAYNLIDGIDGLAGSIGLVAAGGLGLALLSQGDLAGASAALSLAGGLLGFLRYNRAPAQVFMGDTGALPIGFLLAGLSIRLLQQAPEALGSLELLLVAALLLVPIMDTTQVMILRISRGQSPFHPDREHLHHLLLSLGNTHRSAVRWLVGAQASLVGMALLLHPLGLSWSLALMILPAGLFTLSLRQLSRAAARGQRWQPLKPLSSLVSALSSYLL
ncbi:MAG: undecaprenyl/decaprenyl-phosphate alpha-N-acetylglucosaminyl 1-phosphate transferase [Bacteroidetes bacterium]|nr:MAG: undecaprenyl/decaprenyl-phosphate alpha-N-acetylglucosaminyl 1-phosphate transferase [Bacteroidota bacterium]